MYAIITIGNQQFKVENEQVLLTQKTGHTVGEEFETTALLTAEGNKVNIGAPALENKVTLKVIEDLRGDKIRGFKYKKRKNYHRSWGHRQDLQKLQVVKIS